jgi:hypothetical protein
MGPQCRTARPRRWRGRQQPLSSVAYARLRLGREGALATGIAERGGRRVQAPRHLKGVKPFSRATWRTKHALGGVSGQDAGRYG